ncbi:serine/threonine-protein kinase [Hyalangium sp.]|uniref:serine/threonine protein kinase n=1 Tax=Hyalangium sp. TaxID=2028555 RepID=UPI002D3D8910|nr:serine/threonine-protein kinase [Hyalangium sp.]HYH97154.1 serine/threonine-protein kinase [Hyalangium sp.]
MQREHGPAPQPALLPVGTVVGPWRVVGWAGCGVYGAVFRAVHTGEEQAHPIALKLALLPGDPRFPREVKLLARLDHPSIPHLLDHGEWQHPAGTLHPYIAMEWVDGVPLYDWARDQKPDSPVVLRLLAQLTGALQAVHAEGGVHRDVKGANVLVRRADHHAWLIDFGSGTFQGAFTLTPPMGFPGTPAYRSPESWLFELQFSRDSTARYVAGPADDLYSLGVTACRLVTGEYPELGEPTKDENGIWHLEKVIPPAALLLSERVEPQLRALILRMLSVRPEERGIVEQMAEALEEAAQRPSCQSAQPHLTLEPRQSPEEPGAKAAVFELAPGQHEGGRAEVEESSRERGSAPRARVRGSAESRQRWLAPVAVSLLMAVWVWWVAPGQSKERPAVTRQQAAGASQEEGDTAGLGDAAASVSAEEAPGSTGWKGLSEDPLPEPQPGQARPDARGRCPRRQHVALNEGCWKRLNLEGEDCEELKGQLYKGTCYMPITTPGRKPTSSPTSEQ